MMPAWYLSMSPLIMSITRTDMNISSGIVVLVLEAVNRIRNSMDIHQTAEIPRSKISKLQT